MGIKRVFGDPGDGVGGLDVALEKAQSTEGLEYVQVRHEEMAAFMASAHAKFTGGVGVCYATSGPGATHLITGLYDAKMDHVSVVAVVGQQARTAIGAHYQQEIDLQSALNAGKKVAMLVGAGTLNATEEVIAIADRLQAGCAKALLGKAVLPDDLPWVTGGIGLLGSAPSWDLMQDCDTLLVVGSSFPYSEILPKPGTARGVNAGAGGREVLDVALVVVAQRWLRFARHDRSPSCRARRRPSGQVPWVGWS